MIEEGHELAVGADEGERGEDFSEGGILGEALGCAAGVDEEDAEGVEGFFVADGFLVECDGAEDAEGCAAGAGAKAGGIGDDDGLLAEGEECAEGASAGGSECEFVAVAGGLVLVGGGEDEVVPGEAGLMADEGAFVGFGGAGEEGGERGGLVGFFVGEFGHGCRLRGDGGNRQRGCVSDGVGTSGRGERRCLRWPNGHRYQK